MTTNQTQFLSGKEHTILMLSWLQKGPVSTLEVRRRGINHSAGRIRDLRRRGHKIDTHQTKEVSQTGHLVTVALYSLRPNTQMSIFDAIKKTTQLDNN